MNMPEYYKKVVCLQFTLTPEDKDRIARKEPVTFEDQPVKESAGGRYHILLKISDRLIPVHESDWIVHNPGIEIIRDHDFRSQYVSYESIDPVAIEHRLEDFKKQRNQDSK